MPSCGFILKLNRNTLPMYRNAYSIFMLDLHLSNTKISFLDSLTSLKISVRHTPYGIPLQMGFSVLGGNTIKPCLEKEETYAPYLPLLAILGNNHL